jgi:hypothetical protein
MKLIKTLYDDLRPAHLAGLIHVVSVESFPIKFEVTFSHTIATTARDNLYKYLQDKYRVQVWWCNGNTLTIQELVTDCHSRIGYFASGIAGINQG